MGAIYKNMFLKNNFFGDFSPQSVNSKVKCVTIDDSPGHNVFGSKISWFLMSILLKHPLVSVAYSNL